MRGLSTISIVSEALNTPSRFGMDNLSHLEAPKGLSLRNDVIYLIADAFGGWDDLQTSGLGKAIEYLYQPKSDALTRVLK